MVRMTIIVYKKLYKTQDCRVPWIPFEVARLSSVDLLAEEVCLPVLPADPQLRRAGFEQIVFSSYVECDK